MSGRKDSGGDAGARELEEGAGEGGEEGLREGAEAALDGAHDVLRGADELAEGLREALDQEEELLAAPAGDRPLHGAGIELREQGEGDADRDAVVVRSRLELVGEGQSRAAHGDLVRIVVVRQLLPLAAEDVVEGEEEEAGIFRLCLFAEGLERLSAVDALRDAGLEELAEQVLVREHVTLAGLAAQLPGLFEDALVVLEEGAFCLVFVADEGVNDEEAARAFGVDGAVVGAAVADDGEAVDGDLLFGHHLGGALGPVRVGVAAARGGRRALRSRRGRRGRRCGRRAWSSRRARRPSPTRGASCEGRRRDGSRSASAARRGSSWAPAPRLRSWRGGRGGGRGGSRRRRPGSRSGDGPCRARCRTARGGCPPTRACGSRRGRGRGRRGGSGSW